MPKPKKAGLPVVRLAADLAAHVDAWAATHAVDRAQAFSRLVEIGLKAEAGIASVPRHTRDDLAIEADVAGQIGLLIDPETPGVERGRRLPRLPAARPRTEGPPECVGSRIALPGRRPK